MTPRDRLRPYAAVIPGTKPSGLERLAQVLGASRADVRELLGEPRTRPAPGFRVSWHPKTRLSKFVGTPIVLAVGMAFCGVSLLAAAQFIGLIPGGNRFPALVVGGSALFLGLGIILPFVFGLVARYRYHPEIWIGAGTSGIRVGLLISPREAMTVTGRAVLRVIEERREGPHHFRKITNTILHFDSVPLASNLKVSPGEMAFLEGWLKFPADAAASVSSVSRSVSWIVEVSLGPEGANDWTGSTSISVVAEG